MSKTIAVVIIFVSLIVYSLCSFNVVDPRALIDIITQEYDFSKHIPYHIPEENGSYELYFCPREDCEQILYDKLEEHNDIKCAFFDLDLEKIVDILVMKNASVLIDEEDYHNNEHLYTDNFIKITSSGLMHHKFCILDQEIVIMGSMNPTFRGTYKNNNNLFVIESKYLSQNYLNEFYHIMSYEGKYRTDEQEKTYPVINHNNFIIKNYFCPSDKCEEKVIEELKKAKHSIYFMTFSFTSDAIGDYLINKKDELTIKGIFEKTQAGGKYSEYHKMKNADMDVILDANKANMHHKVFIIDNTTAIFGSYNPTKNGNERNDENILIISNENTTSEFLSEFGFLRAQKTK